METKLRMKAEKTLNERRGLRSPRTEDIFTQRYLIGPDDLYVENYPRRRPLSAFNPGAVLKGDKVYIFPRLVFDYYCYTSSIGVTELSVEELLSGKVASPLRTRIILWPQKRWEAIKGCEDPRIFVSHENLLVLYTGVGKFDEDGKEVEKSVLAFAELDSRFSVLKKGFFTVVDSKCKLALRNKDSAFIEIKNNKATMLTRPSLPGIPDMCWRAKADLEELAIPEETLCPVFPPEAWEYKVGWSTNTVRLSQGEYLVGWHGVLREDNSYRNGLAFVNQEGELLAISHYLLAPQGLQEEYGDRSLTIFGDGLLLYKDFLVWIGGVSDYAIGIFIANTKEALSMLRRV